MLGAFCAALGGLAESLAALVMSRLTIVYDEVQIAKRVDELAKEIAENLPKDIVLLAILKGGAVFAADLLRRLGCAGMEPEIEFLRLESYGSDRKSLGAVRVIGVPPDLTGRPVLVTDAIVETGCSLGVAQRIVASGGAERAWTCVLVEKPGRQEPVAVDFAGFQAGSGFLVGYGTDAAEAYRHLPSLATLDDG